MAIKKKVRRKTNYKTHFKKWGLQQVNFDMNTGKKLIKPLFMTRDGQRIYPATGKGFQAFINDVNKL